MSSEVKCDGCDVVIGRGKRSDVCRVYGNPTLQSGHDILTLELCSACYWVMLKGMNSSLCSLKGKPTPTDHEIFIAAFLELCEAAAAVSDDYTEFIQICSDNFDKKEIEYSRNLNTRLRKALGIVE